MPHRGFEEVVLPHLDAAFNYARWLTKSDADAEDVVQDAAVRALRFFSSLRNDDARAWLLTIVRNTWYARFSKPWRADQHLVLDDMKDELRMPELIGNIAGFCSQHPNSCSDWQN